MAGEADDYRNAGVRTAEEEWRRALEFVPHMVQAKGKAASGANLMVAGNINQVMDDMYGTLNLLTGNPSAAEAFRIQNETLMITAAATTNPQIGWGVGNALRAEKKFMELAQQDAAMDQVESRIAGSPELQRAEAAKRVQIDGRTDVLTKGEVGKGLLTQQPIVVSKPAEEPPAADTQQRRDQQQRRSRGLGLLGLDS